MTDDKYNGFTNYETWVTVLWLENDEKLHRKATQYANTAHDFFGSTKERDDFFEKWVVESLDRSGWKGVWDSDFPITVKDKELMKKDMGSTWRINWKEVVDRFVEESKLNYETWRALNEASGSNWKELSNGYTS